MIITRLLRKVLTKEQARNPAITLDTLAAVLSHSTYISKIVVTTDHGVFAFDPRDKTVGWVIATTGRWELAETGLVKAIVRDGDFVVDVGANLGWYTVVMARLVGKRGRVMAFEPDPRNFQLLSENISVNEVAEIVRAHQVALLDSVKDASLELSETNFGDHRVRFDRDGADASLIEAEQYGESHRSVIAVTCTTLDQALYSEGKNRQPQGRIRLIKVDCQGSEVAILRGAQRALSETDYLISEFWPYGIRRAGYEPQEFVAIMEKNFGSFLRIQNSGDGQPFKPISMLGDDVRTIKRYGDYAFRSRTLG